MCVGTQVLLSRPLALAMSCILMARFGSPEVAADSAARIALLAMATQARIPVGATNRLYSLDGGNPATFDSAARALVPLPKPVLCRAALQGEVILVRCVSLPDSLDAARQARADNAHSYERTILAASQQPDDPLLLIKNRSGDSLFAPLSAFVAFARDYLVPGFFGIQDRNAGDPTDYVATIILGPPVAIEFPGP